MAKAARGRPPLRGEVGTRFTLRLPTSYRSQLDQRAKKFGVNLQDMAAAILDQAFEGGSAEERAQKLQVELEMTRRKIREVARSHNQVVTQLENEKEKARELRNTARFASYWIKQLLQHVPEGRLPQILARMNRRRLEQLGAASSDEPEDR